MALQNDPGGLLAPYPSPPAYLWREFTKEKCARMRYVCSNTQDIDHHGSLRSGAGLVNVPSELEYLQPPSEPPDGKWRLFGQLHDLSDKLPALEDHGIARLGPATPHSSVEKDAHANKVFELKKLSKSLLLNFLELVGILSMNSYDASDKLSDLQTIFYNMHQQVNEWRPHQTREALIAVLQSQLEKTRNETRTLQETTDNVRKALVRFSQIQDPKTSAVGVTGLMTDYEPFQSPSIENTRYVELWASLDENFD